MRSALAARLARKAGTLLAVLGALAPAPVFAQAGSTPWVSLDSQPPGTPARIVLNAELSGPSATYFDVFISGFYVTTRLGGDGRTYQDVAVPGLPSYVTPGEPRVPIVRADLGIVTDAAGASLIQADALDLRVLPGYMVWPSPIPPQIHDGTPSQFVRDSVTYASGVNFPYADGLGGVTRRTLGGIPASLCTAFPVHWNPVLGTLSVAAHARFGFGHGGGLSTPMDLTTGHANAASVALLNWGAISSQYAIDWTKFKGAYLFVCQVAWIPDLLPLINEKKSRGFSVTVVNVPSSGETCGQLQQIIRNWYAGTPVGYDHYCLLVGANGSTPACADSNGQLSDKFLSSMDSDLESEIFLGRLYVGSQAELKNQVKKILDYETGPQVNNDQSVLLVAHYQQDQDFDFQSYQEIVRTSPYAQVSPNFTTCYGTNPFLDNTNIINDIAGGVGLVAYMGHGEPDRWLHWGSSDASFNYTDASQLMNGALTPVVWSIACQTADPRVGTSLASGFMKNTQGGAVSFYGAVDPTYGTSVQALEDSLFQAVYGRGVTRQGLAIALGEHAAILADSLFGGDALYKYMLYGDPEMEIKRQNSGGVSVPIDLVAPLGFLAPCPGAGCCPTCPAPIVDIRVQEASGAPVAGVKVALWKPRATGGDEVLDNRYSGPDGWVHIPVPELTAGMLYVGFDGGQNRTGLDSIPVDPPVSAVAEGSPRPIRFAAMPNVTAASTRFGFGRALGLPAQVSLFGVDGRLVRVLNAPVGAAFLDWDGRDGRGRLVAAGIYLARLTAGVLRPTTRIVVVR